MSFHLCADYTQLYLSFDTKDPISKGYTVAELEFGIAEIRSWLFANRLQLHDDKTEYLQSSPATNTTSYLHCLLLLELKALTQAHQPNIWVYFLETISQCLLILTMSLRLPTSNSTKSVGSRDTSPFKLFTLLFMY